MQHLNVKMNSLTSGDSWSILRDQLGLKDMLTPTYVLKDLKKAVDKFTMEEMGMQEFVFDAKESTTEDPQFVRGTSMSLRQAMTLAIDVWKKECQSKGFKLLLIEDLNKRIPDHLTLGFRISDPRQFPEKQ